MELSRMIKQLRFYKYYFFITFDILIYIIALICAYLLRFDFNIPEFYHQQIISILIILLPVKVIIFGLCGAYKGLYRYTSLNTLIHILFACVASMVFYVSITFFIVTFRSVPRSVFLLDCILTFLMTGGLRIGIRLFYNFLRRSDGLVNLCQLGFNWSPRNGRKSLIIIGAGDAGEKIYREIQDNPRLNYHVVGFLDDDKSKWGRSLHGVKVHGAVAMLPEINQSEKIEEVLIAIPSASGAQMRVITKICNNCKIRYRTLPELGAIVDGKVSIKSIRDVEYEDLLRRSPVNLDNQEILKYLRGKQVLVTGAGGSIGSELCRQIIRFLPAELILVDVSELNLFNLQMQMEHEFNFRQYQCILNQVQNLPIMEDIFKSYRPQVVFHAAAYKHVPILEKNPWEAIYNNVLGSQVVIDLAVKYGVERFVLVSTDKAVRPTNVMGASKRLTELILHSRQGNGTRFMAVRFGNVIGSSGSVLPLFQRQIEKGGPITVTDPEVTRYFMTIPEAAQLILQAAGVGEGGEIFVLEMGTPLNIAKMAEELVRLSGKEVGKDVEIIFTGLREGEKLHEELIIDDEGIMSTKYEKIMVLRDNGWNGKKKQSEFNDWLANSIKELFEVTGSLDAWAIKTKLAEIIPEYVPQNVESVLKK